MFDQDSRVTDQKGLYLEIENKSHRALQNKISVYGKHMSKTNRQI